MQHFIAYSIKEIIYIDLGVKVREYTRALLPKTTITSVF
jgi:hypothetical protein